MGSWFGWGDAHDAQKGPEGNGCGREGLGGVRAELPVEEEGLGEALVEEAEAGDDGAVGPAFVSDFEDVDLEGIAGGGLFEEDGAGEGVDAGSVDGAQVIQGRGGADLAAGGVEGVDVYSVSGGDVEARREGCVPEGVSGLGGEGMGGHEWRVLHRAEVCGLVA